MPAPFRAELRAKAREQLGTVGSGNHYGALMTLAGQYAYAGREWVARKVVEILGGRDRGSRHCSRPPMFSTVHGAGRVMSRTEAAGKRNWRTGKVLKPRAVSPAMMQAWVREKGVILRGGGLDESPHVYRRLPQVLGAQKGTIEVQHTLHPLIVVMAGDTSSTPQATDPTTLGDKEAIGRTADLWQRMQSLTCQQLHHSPRRAPKRVIFCHSLTP